MSNDTKINWDDPNLDIDKIKKNIDWDDPSLNLDMLVWDVLEWFITEKSDTINKITNFDIDYLENKLNIRIDIYEYWVSIYEKESDLEIWAISKWIYSHNWVESNDHLYKKVHENYRWKWFWSILFNLYKNNFWLPSTEMSHKNSVIKFLSKNWYTLSSRISNWSEIELNYDEINDIIYWDHNNDDLNTTYKLILD